MIDFYFILDLGWIYLTNTIKSKFTALNISVLTKACFSLLLGCDAFQFCERIPTFRGKMPSSMPKSVSTHKTRRCHSPENHILATHHRRNLETYVTLSFFHKIVLILFSFSNFCVA
jgi:hypothetical protein